MNLGICYSSLEMNKEAATFYLNALALNSKARHAWGYLESAWMSENMHD